MRQFLTSLKDAARSQLWPLPVASVIAALVVGLTLPRLDTDLDASLPGWLSGAVFGGDAGAARTVLDAVSSSLITVTSLTFSLTVVTLQLASSQFSPRLLRTFSSDMFVQATLGVFLATFTFSLTVLRAVRSADEGGSEVVPRLAVTFSFLLAIASVVVLVLFLAHLARQIRVETMLHEVHEDATETFRSTLDRLETTTAREPAVGQRPSEAWRVLSGSSGFLVRVDGPQLVRVCTEMDLVVVLDTPIGSHLVEGTPIGWAWSSSGSPTPEDARGRHRDQIGAALRTGMERTAINDIGYGLRQLTDVANKALSPGINDPTTAVHALGHISAVLCQLTQYDLGPVVLADDDGQTRVVLARPDLSSLIEVAIGQPRRYGAADPQVMQRLFQLLEELGWHCRPDQRQLVERQLKRLNATVQAQDFDPAERALLDGAATRVRLAIAARTTTTQGAQE